jgi:septal ring factor EnvC (AmiA/AmiB activator)
VPLDEKYNNAEHDVEVIIESENEEFLTYRKFKKDLSWIEKVLRAVIINLQRSFYFDDLTKILNDDEMTREEEQTLLSSKKFNQSELRKLRQYMESERRELTSQIQKVTEELGNLKDELNVSQNLVWTFDGICCFRIASLRGTLSLISCKTGRKRGTNKTLLS